MITVFFNRPEFEYDVHSLIKAFFPKEDIKMYYTCSPEEVKGQNLACTHHEDGGKVDTEDAAHVFFIHYEDTCVHVNWMRKADSLGLGEQARDPLPILNCDFNTDYSDRTVVKNLLKQHLYDLLEKGTGQHLPWGTLTGIRPTKIPMKLLQEGKNELEIASYMKETYLASDEKINLSIEIAKRERKLLE